MVHKEIVVLQRCEDIKSPQPGTIVSECSQCHNKVWVGPNIYMHKQARYAERWCTQCYLAKIGPDNKFDGKNIKGMESI